MAAPLRILPGGLRRFMRSTLDRYMPVSDDKISLEYKLKRWLEGTLLPADEAHFFWNGTFSNEQRRQIRPGSNGNGLRGLVAQLDLPRSGVARYLAVGQHYHLTDDILYQTDRMRMGTSHELRAAS